MECYILNFNEMYTQLNRGYIYKKINIIFINNNNDNWKSGTKPYESTLANESIRAVKMFLFR